MPRYSDEVVIGDVIRADHQISTDGPIFAAQIVWNEVGGACQRETLVER
jgi:hypothetical protein